MVIGKPILINLVTNYSKKNTDLTKLRTPLRVCLFEGEMRRVCLFEGEMRRMKKFREKI